MGKELKTMKELRVKVTRKGATGKEVVLDMSENDLILYAEHLKTTSQRIDSYEREILLEAFEILKKKAEKAGRLYIPVLDGDGNVVFSSLTSK